MLNIVQSELDWQKNSKKADAALPSQEQEPCARHATYVQSLSRHGAQNTTCYDAPVRQDFRSQLLFKKYVKTEKGLVRRTSPAKSGTSNPVIIHLHARTWNPHLKKHTSKHECTVQYMFIVSTLFVKKARNRSKIVLCFQSDVGTSPARLSEWAVRHRPSEECQNGKLLKSSAFKASCTWCPGCC